MSTRQHWITWHVGDCGRSLDTLERCVVCDDEANAFWAGAHGTIGVCRTCAIETLPLLIADALDVPDPDRATRTLDRIAAAFWRGLFLRVIRKPAQTIAAALNDQLRDAEAMLEHYGPPQP